MENQEEEYISYRITTKNKYIVYKSSYGGNDYYKIMFEKKNRDGTKIKIYRNLKFVHCEPPNDKDTIRIQKAFEDNYIDPKNKYNDVCVLVVMAYEKIVDEKALQNEVYENFHRNIEENEFDENSLPF